MNKIANARQYSSSFGRFMTPDLLAGSIFDPQSLNHYTYTDNNPLNFVDPSGMSDCIDGHYGCGNCLPDDGCSFDLLGGSGVYGWDMFGNTDPIGCGWSDFWGGDCAVENRMLAGFFARADINLLPGNRCFETITDYICTNTANGDFWFYTGRGGNGIGSGKYFLRASSDCGNGGDREILYDLVQQTSGQVTPAMNFTVQEQIQVLSGSLSSSGAPQAPNTAGYSGYDDYISGTGTRDTLQTFVVWAQGGPQISVFARDVLGHDYGTNGIYVQGAQGAQPAQVFVNNHPTPPGGSCVFPRY